MSRQGWICPRCQTVHAPWVPSCDCQPRTAKRTCPSCNGTGRFCKRQVCATCRGAGEI